MVTKRGASSSLGTSRSAQNVQVDLFGGNLYLRAVPPYFCSLILVTFGNPVNKRMFFPLRRLFGPRGWERSGVGGICKVEESVDVSWVIRLSL